MLYTASTLTGPASRALSARHGRGRATRRLNDRPAGRPRAGAARRRRGIALLVFGTLLDAARPVAERLDATLVNMRFVKPLDARSPHRTRRASPCPGHHRGKRGRRWRRLGRRPRCWPRCGVLIPLLQLGIPDRFIEHGSRESCLAAARLDARGSGDSIERWWQRAGTGASALRGRRSVAAREQPVGQGPQRIGRGTERSERFDSLLYAAAGPVPASGSPREPPDRWACRARGRRRSVLPRVAVSPSTSSRSSWIWNASPIGAAKAASASRKGARESERAGGAHQHAGLGSARRSCGSTWPRPRATASCRVPARDIDRLAAGHADGAARPAPASRSVAAARPVRRGVPGSLASN